MHAYAMCTDSLLLQISYHHKMAAIPGCVHTQSGVHTHQRGSLVPCFASIQSAQASDDANHFWAQKISVYKTHWQQFSSSLLSRDHTWELGAVWIGDVWFFLICCQRWLAAMKSPRTCGTTGLIRVISTPCQVTFSMSRLHSKSIINSQYETKGTYPGVLCHTLRMSKLLQLRRPVQISLVLSRSAFMKRTKLNSIFCVIYTCIPVKFMNNKKISIQSFVIS